MRIVVCVKYVPVLSALRFDPGTRRLVREGVPGEASSFDVRALGAALALRRTHGGEVVALTMGPPAARDGLVHCLALGADRAIHLLDPLLAGSDTLATARALSAALRREAPDVVLLGRASVDAETGQVGPEVAELLGWPQVTAARRLSVDPATRRFTAEREADDGFETLAGQLPAVVTAAEDLAEERFPTKAERQAAATKPIATLRVADLGLAPGDVGLAGPSRTRRARRPRCWPRRFARGQRASCWSARPRSGETWPPALRRASAAGSRAMRSTSTSTPRAGCGSTSRPSAAPSWRPSCHARVPRWRPYARGCCGLPSRTPPGAPSWRRSWYRLPHPGWRWYAGSSSPTPRPHSTPRPSSWGLARASAAPRRCRPSGRSPSGSARRSGPPARSLTRAGCRSSTRWDSPAAPSR